ncbi:MAG: protein kinase domain-containing protein [Pirellula sp.]|jgi:serine/threonine protein kinase/formylglycine-generating enzyme required for sulfatase activity
MDDKDKTVLFTSTSKTPSVVGFDVLKRDVIALGCITEDEFKTVVAQDASVSSSDSDASTVSAAKELVRQGKLTSFQAQFVLAGRARGLMLGPYLVLDKIGQGGMGNVYRARHQRMNRIVAIKVLNLQGQLSSELTKRFERETRAAAKLIHPNIVTAFDAGEEGKTHFLVMEYVDGQDLKTLIDRKGPLSIRDAIDYTIQAAQGLQYAHEQNIIHRDIKPANLLLDQSGCVKVLDMGLARIGEGANVEDWTTNGLTADGTVMGTMDYMSPEQGTDTRTADVRSDIYSLGCTLYTLLTREPMYPGGSLFQKITAHRESLIPSVRTKRSDVPVALEQVITRMVAKKPSDRPQSMAAVIDQLKMVLARPADSTESHSVAKGVSKSGAMAGDGETVVQQAAETKANVPKVPAVLASTSSSAIERLMAKKKSRQFKERLYVGGLAASLFLAAFGFYVFNRSGKSAVQVENKKDVGGTASSRTPSAQPLTLRRGKMTVTVEPSTAKLFILDANGSRTEQKLVNGLNIVMLAPGEYTLEASCEGYDNHQEKLEILADQSASRSIVLKRVEIASIESASRSVEPDASELAMSTSASSTSASSTSAAEPKPEGTASSEVDMEPAKDPNDPAEIVKALGVESANGGTDGKMAAKVDAMPLDRETPSDSSNTAQNKRSQSTLGRKLGKASAIPVVDMYDKTTGWETGKGIPEPGIVPFNAKTAAKLQEQWAKYYKVPRAFTNKIGMVFVLIPPGEFQSGFSDEDLDQFAANSDGLIKRQDLVGRNYWPKHRVVIPKPYYIGITEVTLGQYQYVAGEKEIEIRSPDAANAPAELDYARAIRFCNAISLGHGLSQPYKYTTGTVISTGDIGFRLPSEYEWEYAGRAGSDSRFWCQPEMVLSTDWFLQNSQRIRGVAQLTSNPFGLYDVQGNAEELVQGYNKTIVESPPVDGLVVSRISGDVSGLVTCGGKSSQNLWLFHFSKRYRYGPEFSPEATGGGIRLVIDVEAVQSISSK